MPEIVITDVRVVDLRFPTSRHHIGSDAVNKDPDYSAAYCILETNAGLSGYGLTFTLGRGNELCVLALEYLARYVKGRSLASLTQNMAAFCRELTDDSQFRWLGPEKGIIHLATGALINAVWDLWRVLKASHCGDCSPRWTPSRSSPPSNSATSTMRSRPTKHAKF